MSAQQQEEAVLVMTGTPWALATARWPGDDARHATLLACDLLAQPHRPLLHLTSPAHLSSMLWGVCELAHSNTVPRGFVRAAFLELEELEAVDMRPMDWVNLLYAAAGLRYHNHRLLRVAADALSVPGALSHLSGARITELAFAAGTLRLHSVCVPLASRHVIGMS